MGANDISKQRSRGLKHTSHVQYSFLKLVLHTIKNKRLFCASPNLCVQKFQPFPKGKRHDCIWTSSKTCIMNYFKIILY